MQMPKILSKSPLSLVLVQVRFPSGLTALGERNYDKLNELFNNDYPFAKTKSVPPLQIQTDSGTIQVGNVTQRRVYSTADLSWNVTIAESFINVYCICERDIRAYTGREDCVDRLKDVLGKISTLISVDTVSRIAYRYVNRIPYKNLQKVEGLFKSESLGFVQNFATSRMELSNSTNEANFVVDQDSSIVLNVRSGVLGPGDVPDPSVKPIKDSSTWVVDMDASQTEKIPTDISEMAEQIRHLANIEHDFFAQHIITEEFIKEYK
ncbi:TIGR04255 family protein [Bifidobacterium sp. ESL0682]|uniref:TIGR04255 family protein n=1 Tax=Bifidobacterium sp. ESL0682 TaxID=2983212 RepID=UPI0023F86656|nr:TIGR04255 family protein [Bifidobacterium sp. ESL0682]WEV42243.1 TIGR04255 family protein [Bifidobacterium sp. ESL0682]